jgi:cellobiose phosphorylase
MNESKADSTQFSVDLDVHELTYRHRSAIYHIVVENAAGTGRGVRAVTVDAQAVADGEIPLMDDGKTHEVRVELG